MGYSRKAEKPKAGDPAQNRYDAPLIYRLGVISVTRYFILPLYGLLFGLRWRGARHIPERGPFILAPNHQSWLDPPMVGIACRRRWPGYMASAKYFKIPVVDHLMKVFRVIPVDLKARFDRNAYRLCHQALEEGRGLIVFPEGTRCHDGRLGKVQPGVARLAIQAGAPIIPVGITGAFEAWPRHRKLPRPMRRIRMKFYPPLQGAPGENAREMNAQVAALNEKLEKTLDRRVRAYYRLRNRG